MQVSAMRNDEQQGKYQKKAYKHKHENNINLNNNVCSQLNPFSPLDTRVHKYVKAERPSMLVIYY